ncbi:hypothetical protein ACGFYA_20620 [Streptomyces sp. NPDC048305]|uniref:hypothetical protein n=1 Tax=Streptomyces sp. NPDC048305 TaxID=3365532 RepID=UPI0037202CCE
MLVTWFMAPTVLITCECGDVFAGYENGDVIKVRDAEEGECGSWVGGTVADYREDPQCSGCLSEMTIRSI